MANFVVKKDGTKVPFDAEKIKRAISAAATQAGLPENEVTEVVDQVLLKVIESFTGTEEVASAEIREKVLSELDVVKPAVSESWRKHDQSKVQ